MRLTLWSLLALLASMLPAFSGTEEKINQRFSIPSGGTVLINVDFGSIDVQTNDASEVVVEVVRRVTRETKEREDEFLASCPVLFSQQGNLLAIRSAAKGKKGGAAGEGERTEATYTIKLPSPFTVQLRSARGAIKVSDLEGSVNADTSGGALKFERVRGPLNGKTAGGAIAVAQCAGALNLMTSGGAIEVAGGSGSLAGVTAGGPMTVKEFHGDVEMKSSGGGLTVSDVVGKVSATTAGGPISASFASAPSDGLKLETAGGAVTLRVPESAAFDLDAATATGRVSSELSVEGGGKPSKTQLKGPVNGGGRPVVLRTSGGNIQVRKF